MVATDIGTHHHAELARPNRGRAPSGPTIFLRSILRDIRHVSLVALTFGLLSGPTITLGVAPEGDDTSASPVAAASALPQQEALGVLARQTAVGVRKLRGGEWIVDRVSSFGL